MKKNLYIFFAIFGLLFILCINKSSAESSTSCEWQEEFTYYDEGIGAEVFTPACSPVSPSSKCTDKKPEDYTTNEGSIKYVCCCWTVAAKTKTPDLNPLGNLQVKIPGLDELAKKYPATCETNAEGKTVNCKIPWIAIYIKAIYNYMLLIGGIVAVIALMIGGVIWLVSAGNASRISEAKSWITGSITGVVILLSSYILLDQINPNLVGYKYLKLESIQPIEIDVSINETSENPYLKACQDAKKGNLQTCQAIGNIRPSNTILVYGNVYADQTVYKKYQDAMSCVRTKNGNKDLFKIKEGWRGPTGQIDAKKYWTAKGTPKNAADPCCSNHGSGRALDMIRIDGAKMSWEHNESSGLKACMNAQGLFANLPTEPWHWSPTGK